MTIYKDAKSIFFAHNGEKYYMSLNGVLDEYKRFNIPEYIESEWLLDLFNEQFSILYKDDFNLDNIAKFRDIIQLLKKLKKYSLILKAMQYLEENFDKYDSFASVMLLEIGIQLSECLDGKKRYIFYQKLIDFTSIIKKKEYIVKEIPKFLSANDVSLNAINKRIDCFYNRLSKLLEEYG